MSPLIIEVDTLKILSAVFMFYGTVLVSWRVTAILKALSFAVEILDLNEQIRIAKERGETIKNLRMTGAHENVRKVEIKGAKLLVAGFLMQIIGVSCNVMSFFV